MKRRGGGAEEASGSRVGVALGVTGHLLEWQTSSEEDGAASLSLAVSTVSL